MLKCVRPNHAVANKTGQIMSSRLTGTRRVNMVTDDGKVEGTVDLDTAMGRLEDVISHEFLVSIDVFANRASTSQPRDNIDVHTVHKPKRYQAFTSLSMFPTNRSGKPKG